MDLIVHTVIGVEPGSLEGGGLWSGNFFCPSVYNVCLSECKA